MPPDSVTALAEVQARKFGPSIPFAVNSSSSALKTIHIILVEDNFAESMLIQKEISKAFQSSGYHLESARTQSQALQMLNDKNFDVVLLDLTLPDATGLETLMRLQMDFLHLPVIVLTGYEDEDFALEAIGNGAQDYLVKDRVSGQILKRALQYAVQRKRLELDLHEARQQAEESNREKSNFLISASQELCAPLNTISDSAQSILLDQEPLSNKQLDGLQSIFSASDHLLSLINNILDPTKMNPQKIMIETGSVAEHDRKPFDDAK